MPAIKYRSRDGKYRTLTIDELRKLTADRCRAIPGFSDLPAPQKNIICDQTRAQIVRELQRRIS